MNPKFISALLLLAASIIISKVNAHSVKCKGQDVEIKEEHAMEMKECFTAVGISSPKELNTGNGGCFSKCVMMKKSMIDDAGKPHKESINKMMSDNLPDFVKAEWMEAMGKCLDSEGSQVDATAADKTCASFLPLSLCVHAAFVNICKM